MTIFLSQVPCFLVVVRFQWLQEHVGKFNARYTINLTSNNYQSKNIMGDLLINF